MIFIAIRIAADWRQSDVSAELRSVTFRSQTINVRAWAAHGCERVEDEGSQRVYVDAIWWPSPRLPQKLLLRLTES